MKDNYEGFKASETMEGKDKYAGFVPGDEIKMFPSINSIPPSLVNRILVQKALYDLKDEILANNKAELYESKKVIAESKIESKGGFIICDTFAVKDKDIYLTHMSTNVMNDVMNTYCRLINLGYMGIDLIDVIGFYRCYKYINPSIEFDIMGINYNSIEYMCIKEYITINDTSENSYMEYHDEILVKITDLLCNMTRYEPNNPDPLKRDLAKRYRKAYFVYLEKLWDEKYPDKTQVTENNKFKYY